MGRGTNSGTGARLGVKVANNIAAIALGFLLSVDAWAGQQPDSADAGSGNLADRETVATLAANNSPSPARDSAKGGTLPDAVSATTGNANAASVIVGYSARMLELAYADDEPNLFTRGLGPTADCVLGYRSPSDLVRQTPALMPGDGGVFYTGKELETWRERIASGRFVRDNDFLRGSPGDWDRIVSNARVFLARDEAVLPLNAQFDLRARHGSLARDAAFHYLVKRDVASLSAVRDYLLSQAGNPGNDFTSLCIRPLSGPTRDAFFAESTWFLRYLVTYDFVRSALNASDRVAIENYVRRQGHFFAAHGDWGIELIFPKRQQGNYSVRGRDAKDTGAAVWHAKRVDSNGDCKIDSNDNPLSYPVHAYTRGDGTVGPRIPILALWFNNRRSVNALAFGVAGLVLAEPPLIARSKRYFMEWLTYSVFPDGSEGEFERNGDYCIPNQGLFYAAQNIVGAMMLARALDRQGDNSLSTFRTKKGLFGTESLKSAKSLELVAGTQVALKTGKLRWYFHEIEMPVQKPRDSTFLGEMTSYYMGGKKPTDNYHELGMIVAASVAPNVSIAGLVLRDPATTSLRFPGSTGNGVTTGWGDWSDPFGALPAALLIRDIFPK